METQKVLVVDDCRMSTLVLRHILGRDGIRSESASTGSEALEKASRGGFALVLIDVMLPDLDGFEVTRRLQLLGCDPFPRIYLLTAMGELLDPERIEAAGIDGIFFKPVAPSRIVEVARLSLDRAASPPAVPH